VHERHSFHALTKRRPLVRKYQNPLAILFGQEDTLVLLARKVCPKKLEGQLTAPISE
jgi:hypothetical protein